MLKLVGLVGVGVVHPRSLQRGAANRQPRREHRRQPREAAREVVRRLRVRGRDLADAGAEPLQLAPEPMRLRRRGGDFADRAVTTPQVGGPELSDRIEDPGLERGRVAPRGERVAVGPVDGRNRDLPGRERGLEAAVEREALERVVGRSDPVEVAPEPARREPRVRRADLPVVPRGEVRLVRARVADRRDHADLAFAVQLCERGQGRMPVQPAVLAERRSRGLRERERRAVLVVERVRGREEHRQRVRSAVEEDRDEHAVVRRRVGKPVDVEDAQPVEAVHGQRGAEPLREEASTRQSGSRRRRHSGLDRRQAVAGDRVRAAEVVAGAGSARHEVWTSGESASSCRTACSATSGVLDFNVSCARRVATARVGFVSVRTPSAEAARSTSAGALRAAAA